MSYDETGPRDILDRDIRIYDTNKTPVSMAGRLAIANITQPNAIQQCKDIDTHLMTMNEWMAIARNIEAQDSNWSG